MSPPPAPRAAGPPAAIPPRPPKHRDFKPALARAQPPAMPSPARPAVLRAPPPTPAAAQPGVVQAPSLRPWETRPNASFRQRIAEAERSAEHPQDGYGQRNPSSGALGRYQFLPIALRDIGWMDAEGEWTAAAAAHGATDEDSFLATPPAQEAAMSAFLGRQEAILDRMGTLASAGQTIAGLDGTPLRLTEGALVAAAHRRGAGMLARYIAHRAETPEAPLTPTQHAAFTSIEARLRIFAEVAYTSERPGSRMLARRGAPAA